MPKATTCVIIDDNTDFLFAMETFLSRKGFIVFTAETGEEGVALVFKERPDIVLLDVMMETLFSGFEVCRSIRSHEEVKDTPIIGISGMNKELDVSYDKWPDWEYFRPNEFMEKPVDREKLLRVIDKVLKKAEENRKKPKWRKAMDEKLEKKWLKTD